MIASLPMYDRPEVQDAHDRLWRSVRRNFGFGPDHLTRSGDPWDDWHAPDLLLSQTCGYPYRTALHGDVTLVGTPDYGLEDCPAGYYFSVFVARRDDPRDDPAEFAASVFAYNDPRSQSGWAAPACWAEERGMSFSNTLQTGSHQASARAVADGRAALAAIDAQTWRMILRYDRFAESLHVLGRTRTSPGLPLITAYAGHSAELFSAFSTALADITVEDKYKLGLRGITHISTESYLAVPTPAPPPA